MLRRYIGAVCAVAPMFIFACVLVGSTFARVDNLVDRRDGVYDVSHSSLDDSIAQYPVPRTTRATERGSFLRKRGLRSSREFKKALKTGRRILKELESPKKTTKRPFDKISDLQDWGWQSIVMSEEVIRSTLSNYAVVLEAKCISINSPTLVGVKWTHAHETEHDGLIYPETHGTYALILDPPQGLLIPTLSYSPAHLLQKQNSKNPPSFPSPPLPHLQHWSDIAFLTWQHHTTPSTLPNLRLILAINALNQATVDVVSEALRKDGVGSGVPPVWPGHVFIQERAGPFGDRELFPAVLGTPNVRGSGWLVSVLGRKRVGALTVFDSSGFEGGRGGCQLSVLVEVVEGEG